MPFTDFLTVAQIRQHVVTQFEDVAIARHAEYAYSLICNCLGGEISGEPRRIKDVTKYNLQTDIYLGDFPARSIIGISCRYLNTVSNPEDIIEGTHYELNLNGHRLQTIYPYGWIGNIKITYVPKLPPDSVIEQGIIDLVKAEINFSGLRIEQIAGRRREFGETGAMVTHILERICHYIRI